MKILRHALIAVSCGFIAPSVFAHYPFVAPLNYQTFNNHTAVLAGFYDNPFVSEIAIKNFQFHYHTPTGEKIQLSDEQWAKTKTLSSFSLENKIDGTYRIRGEKQGSTARFAYDGQTWKALVGAKPAPEKRNDKVFYTEDLKKKTPVNTVQTVELVETFVSRREISNQVIHHVHDAFDVQFITHPNAIKKGQAIQFNVLDQKKGVADIEVQILAQTTGFSREQKVLQTLKTNNQGELHFNLAQAGQYLLTIDYQQPFSKKADQLKRYKYTLAFNVTE